MLALPAALVCAFTGPGATDPPACDVTFARERLTRAFDLREYVEMWFDLEMRGAAEGDLAQLPSVLDAAAFALTGCPRSRALDVIEADIRYLSGWTERAGVAIAQMK